MRNRGDTKEKHVLYKEENVYVYARPEKPLSQREINAKNKKQLIKQKQQQRHYYNDNHKKHYNDYIPDDVSNLTTMGGGIEDHRSTHTTTVSSTRTSGTSFPCFDPNNIQDHGNTIEWAVDLPGVEPSTLKAVFYESTFTLSGYRKSSNSTVQAFCSEFIVDTSSLDSDSIKANLNFGVLHITADKIITGPPRTIPITSYQSPEEEEEAKKKLEKKEQREELRRKKVERRQQQQVSTRKLDKKIQAKLVKAIPQSDQDFVSLLIEICSARELLKADRFGLSDPYVRVALEDSDIHKTKFIRQTLSPTWSDQHKNKFVWNGKIKNLKQGFTFLLMDHDLLSADDPLGEFRVTMEDLITMNGHKVEYDVTPPAHLLSKTSAGYCTIRVRHATAQDRKQHNAVASTKSFWEPPSDDILKLYRTEKLNCEGGSSSRSLYQSKTPSQKRIMTKKSSSRGSSSSSENMKGEDGFA
mmetsp:Transcript_1937/g.2690  ORF Transcript_1937/g.2690 Transcript_1937/m.2690 type:complete len:469 (+) Transcript_1937:156-1562(+)|eukprot:CAMPEP_0178931306 /NCGR_PEP_ID=MMETSP0786-20121207/21839_1 /TAXON_ID=186022 /ORGANISM="Thalassionema frauenfeldii, Strain CCMP 1798" /LENGTH=468 /DNA_ID=CAMNT_0020608173 /DNA_START=92 /DNA_END=1498 /DNA_ORIENTATION=-